MKVLKFEKKTAKKKKKAIFHTRGKLSPMLT